MIPIWMVALAAAVLGGGAAAPSPARAQSARRRRRTAPTAPTTPAARRQEREAPAVPVTPVSFTPDAWDDARAPDFLLDSEKPVGGDPLSRSPFPPEPPAVPPAIEPDPAYEKTATMETIAPAVLETIAPAVLETIAPVVPAAPENFDAQAAAAELREYLLRGGSFGSARARSAVVKLNQTRMGMPIADGIVGPKTRARALELGVKLPVRK